MYLVIIIVSVTDSQAEKPFFVKNIGATVRPGQSK